jgi:hypothetical protein
MVVFECAACGAALTVPLAARIDRSDHLRCHVANQWMPSLLPPGCYAVGPDRVLVAPGDVRGLSWIEGRLDGCCCGLDAYGDPNLACACGHPVAGRIDDCYLWQVVWLDRAAVRVAGEPDPVAAWDAFDWESVPLTDADDEWRARVEVSAGFAIGRVLDAADGAPVTVPDGPLADAFRRTLDEMRPPGPSAVTLGLAGPGVTAEADVLLVPRHPQTGEAWPAAGNVVPTSAELWVWLARADEQPVLPRTGGQWAAYLDDDPLPRRRKDVRPAGWAIRFPR